MRVKIVQQVSGVRDGVPWPTPGTVIDVPEAEAELLLTAGIGARPDDNPDEKATAPTGRTETATAKRVTTP